MGNGQKYRQIYRKYSDRRTSGLADSDRQVEWQTGGFTGSKLGTLRTKKTGFLLARRKNEKISSIRNQKSDLSRGKSNVKQGRNGQKAR
jgi:hypothetical protein